MGGYVKTITYDDSLYCLVPLEPTVAMKIAGDNAGFWCGDKYKAMLAASPTNVQPEQDPDAMRAAGQCCCDDSE